jgi:hypothetical protein
LEITSDGSTRGVRWSCGTVIAARNTLSPAWHQTLAAWKISRPRRSGINYCLIGVNLTNGISGITLAAVEDVSDLRCAALIYWRPL